VPPAPQNARRSIKLVLGLLISALFLAATLRAVPLGQVAEALADASLSWVLIALGFVSLAYLLKIYRWTVMLRSLGAEVRVGEAAVPFLGGVAFNNVLPFRAGDVIRVIAFQRFTGVPASGQIGTLALERLMDLFVLLALLFATVSFWQVRLLDAGLLAGLQLAAAALAVAVLLFIAAPHTLRLVVTWAERRWPKLHRFGGALLRLSDAVATLSQPTFLFRILLLSLAAWLAEGGVYYAVGQALGVAATPHAALLALSIATLATLIPSAPGYVGTFHYFAARVVAATGGSPVGAAAFAILVHGLLWLSTTASGFLALAISGTRTRPMVAAPANTNSEADPQ
jgi:uncharacterized protein (TIRG00374 family)